MNSILDYTPKRLPRRLLPPRDIAVYAQDLANILSLPLTKAGSLYLVGDVFAISESAVPGNPITTIIIRTNKRVTRLVATKYANALRQAHK